MYPIRREPLQVIYRSLPVGCGPERAIKSTLAEIVFEFKRLAETNSIFFGKLPINSFGGEVVVQRSRGKLAGDDFIHGVPHPDEICAKLLTILHGNKPPCLVASERSTGIRGVLLAMEGRSQARNRLIGGGKALQHPVAFVDGDATVKWTLA